MKNVRFIKSPAYMYDLLCIFHMRFNKDIWFDKFIITNKPQEQTNHYKSILEEFYISSDELSLFFTVMEPKGSFFINNFYVTYMEELLTVYDFDFFFIELSKTKDFVQKMLDHFFTDSGLIADYEDSEFFVKLMDLINASIYTDSVKNKIISFFISPDKYIELLKTEFLDKNKKLTKYYEKNNQKLLNVYESFDIDEFYIKNNMGEYKTIDYSMYEEARISVLLISKNTIAAFVINGVCLHLIGYDYLDSFDFLHTKKLKFEIDAFGKILSDKSRIEILRMLTVDNELTTSEVAKNLNASVNAVFYHLDMMCNADMLQYRSKGRTVFYRLNKEYFNKANDALKDFISKISDNSE